VDHADEVDRDRIQERLATGPVERTDSGLCDDAIEAAELGDARGNSLRQRRPLADVGDGGDHRPADLLDEVLGLLEVGLACECVSVARNIGAKVHADDVGALLGEPHRVRTALAAGCAGNEDGLAVHSAACPGSRACQKHTADYDDAYF
jgi:hypothetical protein